MHVIFTEDGIPGWFGPDPVAGSEALDLDELRGLLPEGAGPEVLQAMARQLLASHMRQGGHWIPRPARPSAEVEDGEACGAAPEDRDG